MICLQLRTETKSIGQEFKKVAKEAAEVLFYREIFSQDTQFECNEVSA